MLRGSLCGVVANVLDYDIRSKRVQTSVMQLHSLLD